MVCMYDIHTADADNTVGIPSTVELPCPVMTIEVFPRHNQPTAFY
jgi:hypothetical protein